MQCLVELSGEHDKLPLAELTAVLEISGGRVLAVDGAIATIETDEPAFLAQRLALAHSISEHWWSGPVEQVLESARPIDATLAVRVRKLEGAHPQLSTNAIARGLGAALKGPVDLATPEVDVRVLIAREAHVGRLLVELDRKAFDARAVKHRAHVAPVSLHPRYARTLVNLARIRAGQRVADPFCGTGGLVIEAGLVGARVLASDLDPRMAEGTRETLATMGVKEAVVETRDVGELPQFSGTKLDVVISDPPYGKSSTTNREPMRELYERFLASAHEALRPGGRLAVIFPSPTLRELAATRFSLIEAYEQRVHGSMTRHYGVFQR